MDPVFPFGSPCFCLVLLKGTDLAQTHPWRTPERVVSWDDKGQKLLHAAATVVILAFCSCGMPKQKQEGASVFSSGVLMSSAYINMGIDAMEPLVGFALYLTACTVVAIVASNKGQRGGLYFLLTLTAGVLLVVVAGRAGASVVDAAFIGFLSPCIGLVVSLSSGTSKPGDREG